MNEFIAVFHIHQPGTGQWYTVAKFAQCNTIEEAREVFGKDRTVEERYPGCNITYKVEYEGQEAPIYE